MSEFRGEAILERCRRKLKQSPMLNANKNKKKDKNNQQQHEEEDEEGGEEGAAGSNNGKGEGVMGWVKDSFSSPPPPPALVSVEVGEVPSKALRTIANIQVDCTDAEDHW
jgi:hypothetical protein